MTVTLTPSRTPVHPVYAAAFEANKKGPAFDPSDCTEYRALANKRLNGIQLPEVIEKDMVVTMGEKTNIKVTLMRPVGTENELLPAVVFFFGGGWVSGSKHTHGKLVRDVCVKANVAIIFPEHSLAPDVKFPTIHEECYSTVRWALENGHGIGIDPTMLAVCGDSAGGNVAAVVCQMAKERQHFDIKAIKSQILIYPSTSPCGRSSTDFPSFTEFGGGDYDLTTEEVYIMEHAYNDNKTEAKMSNHMSPILASVEDLKGLPPALILTAEADVLRDEAEAYARKLTKAGVDTACVRVIGATHGYMNNPVETSLYTQSMAMIKYQLDKAFNRL